MTEIITALITGGLALVGVVITNKSTSKKIEAQLQISQAVTDTKLDELTREVRKHNGFAERVPVLENQVAEINRELERNRAGIEKNRDKIIKISAKE
nr:MAG TPA: Protein of unknown function (DUF2681) [Caudoviricetes sp.]